MTNAILVPGRSTVIRAKRCETCGCATPAPADPSGRALECHRNPPQAVMVPMQTPQGQQIVPAAMFPPVQPDSHCVDGWRPKVEMAN